MRSNRRSYSNPIYDLFDPLNRSFSQPLVINIEPRCSSTIKTDHSHSIPLLLLANCLPTPTRSNQHNYVNQRIEEENVDPLYAKPRKRCVTLKDDPIIIPPKTTRLTLDSIKPERAQLVCTKISDINVLSTNESTDEIDQFIARENDRVERVKLRRRQHKTPPITLIQQSDKPPHAFTNPNYVDMPTVNDHQEKNLSKSILV